MAGMCRGEKIMNAKKDPYDQYWLETVEIAASECGVMLTGEQAEYIAGAAQNAHENYDLSFYSPPSSERLNSIESEWRARHAALQREFDAYRENAERAVHRIARVGRDTSVSIGDGGEVHTYNGRSGTI
jgi:hypothetical protein